MLFCDGLLQYRLLLQEVCQGLMEYSAEHELLPVVLDTCSLLLDVLFLRQSRPLHRQLLALLSRLPPSLLLASQQLASGKVR